MKTFLISILFCSFLISCSPKAKQETQESISADKSASADSVATETTTENKYAGHYRWQEDPQGYYQTLTIEEQNSGEYAIRFSASAIKGKPGCTFEGKATLVNDTLKIPLEWQDKRIHMTLFAHGDTIDVFTENFDDRFALNYYCSGGGSLAGQYYRTAGN